MCRNCLWHKNDGTKGLHLVAWDVLCILKRRDGRGLQSVIMKVSPLRAKFLWNFISKPDYVLNNLKQIKI